MRRPLIAGNWKMHGTLEFVRHLMKDVIRDAKQFTKMDIAVLPPFVYLTEVHRLLENSNIQLGAQNLFFEPKGAFTGEVSPDMLKDIGCHYVLIGHSERRQFFHDDLTTVAKKLLAALQAGLTPILCIGETQAERSANKTEHVIDQQLNSIFERISIDQLSQLIIAYEPVWAIGTGLTATPEQAQQVHAYIRQKIAQNNVEVSNMIRILYGGSMKADNAASLLAMPDVDGGLIGGASLEAKSFLQICQAANDKQ